MRIVPPKSYREVGSPRDQELPVALSASTIGASDGPEITALTVFPYSVQELLDIRGLQVQYLLWLIQRDSQG